MYLGSVRFFRHLILAVLVLLIAVPTTLFVIFLNKYHTTNNKLAQVESVVSAYSQQGDNELADNLAQLLSTSLNEKMPLFQQQVDESVGEQVNILKTDLNSSVDSQLNTLEENLKAATEDSVEAARKQLEKSISNQVSELRKELVAMIAQQDDNLEAQLVKKVDELSASIVILYNETLTDQVALIMEQIEEIKMTLGGK